MGNGVRQCSVCGWTCYGSRSEMKKHRRAAHPKPAPPARARAPRAVDFEAMGAAELGAYPALALAEMEAEEYTEVLDALDHIHDDLRAIREHLGIAHPECAPPAPELEEDPP